MGEGRSPASQRLHCPAARASGPPALGGQQGRGATSVHEGRVPSQEQDWGTLAAASRAVLELHVGVQLL